MVEILALLRCYAAQIGILIDGRIGATYRSHLQGSVKQSLEDGIASLKIHTVLISQRCC